MHDARIKMKDGREFRGPLWAFSPRAGFLSLAGDDAKAGHLHFRDMARAEQEIRSGPDGEVKTVDLLERARNEGWNQEGEDDG